MSTRTRLFTGSGRLCVAQPHAAAPPETISPWAILVRGGTIAWVGAPGSLPSEPDPDETLDLGSSLVTPGLIDAHTHPAFAGDRSDEAAARLAGAAYTGGGILRTVLATREGTDEELEELVEARLRAALGSGVTTIECKSGYGLSFDEELRQLRVIGRVASRMPQRVVRTFLGAHAVPPEAASPAAYVSLVIAEMLPAVANERAAEFCDVFCDRGFFDVASAEAILEAARELGLGIRLHAEQLARTGAAELGVRLGATSVDHLEQLDPDGIAALAASDTVATLLPAPALVMRSRQAPARALLDAGASIALASDANAGTFSGFGSMPLVIGLGATLLGMTIDEAVLAATAGGAAALGLAAERGIIGAGFAADLVAWDAEHEGAFGLRLGGVRPTWIVIGGKPIAFGQAS
jgi:imidazolonepropionase